MPPAAADARPAPPAPANATCPACRGTRFGTRVVNGHVHAACDGCGETYASVLDLIMNDRSSGVRSSWLKRLLRRDA